MSVSSAGCCHSAFTDCYCKATHHSKTHSIVTLFRQTLTFMKDDWHNAFSNDPAHGRDEDRIGTLCQTSLHSATLPPDCTHNILSLSASLPDRVSDQPLQRLCSQLMNHNHPTTGLESTTVKDNSTTGSMHRKLLTAQTWWDEERQKQKRSNKIRQWIEDRKKDIRPCLD